MTTAARTPTRPQPAPASRLGERLRQLRVSTGLTQTELAGERFSKEYVSQIELGKTRPTGETIEWLAARLGADPAFLAKGVSTEQRSRVEAALARAEALSAAHDHCEALSQLVEARSAVLATGAPDLELRLLSGEAWSRLHLGELGEALEVLARARELAEGEAFSDADRADVLFRLGVCRYKLSSISTALGLLNEALALAERSGLPCDLLRSHILSWRSRCYRRQRDFEAAREDVERSLELAESMDDARAVADGYFQASLVAERMGQWVRSRNYAERAKACYEQLDDRQGVGRLLNNLGGLQLMLGKPEQAVDHLKAAFRVALELDATEDAAQASGSLAAVKLHIEDFEGAEEQARHALHLLEGRVDWLHEIGPTQLVLGRALMAQGRLDEAGEMFRAADASAEQLSSVSHRAAAWVALGDLATLRGQEAEAARLYRNAAEALQDVRF
ncbi:MAG: tetratricopeptide repeat protein [Actinomycetota bacterium]|nr:tetratricopeptide repeat protein [Actinomycetota bacterium]